MVIEKEGRFSLDSLSTPDIITLLNGWCQPTDELLADSVPITAGELIEKLKGELKEEMESIPVIKVKYHNSDLLPLEKIGIGDWIDLRAAETVTLHAGEFKVISLGVSIELPEGYEAHVVPRSSTFKNWHIIQTNSMGVIDHSYCGDDDIWMMPVYATRDTEIKLNDRICQFRIVPQMGQVDVETVEHLGNDSRGGFGSTGKQ